MFLSRRKRGPMWWVTLYYIYFLVTFSFRDSRNFENLESRSRNGLREKLRDESLLISRLENRDETRNCLRDEISRLDETLGSLLAKYRQPGFPQENYLIIITQSHINGLLNLN